jgi:hypothetical protein
MKLNKPVEVSSYVLDWKQESREVSMRRERFLERMGGLRMMVFRVHTIAFALWWMLWSPKWTLIRSTMRFGTYRNGFNELKRYQMLWNVRHLWPKGSRLAFNTYRHFNLVIVRRGDGKLAHVIRSEDGLSQGDPLAMALYGVALLPLGEKLRRQAVPGATLPTFADDVAAVGNVVSCARSLEFLSEVGPIYGYFPEPEKTHVICKEEDELEAKVVFLTRGLDVQYSRGQRYLGGFIGRKKERDEWVSAKAEEWADDVRILAGIARKYPQTAYAGLTMSLQAEWQYVARTVPDIGTLLEPVERAIREAFLPTLLGVESITAEM